MANQEMTKATAEPDTATQEQPAMLWFLSKKKLHFVRDEIVDGPTGEKRQKILAEFILTPDADPRMPVLAPAWIRETEFYRLLKGDGSITEAQVPGQAGTVRG